MRLIYALQLAVVALVLGTAQMPHASLLRAMSLAELTYAADSIVVANVRGVRSAWDGSGRTILTTVEVDVDEVWKGSASNGMRIVVLGGAVGDIEMTMVGMPTFATGEKALLFLRGHQHLQVVGMNQGKRSLRWDAGSARWLVQPPASDGVVDVGVGGELRAAKRQAVVSLPELREQVGKLVGRTP